MPDCYRVQLTIDDVDVDLSGMRVGLFCEGVRRGGSNEAQESNAKFNSRSSVP